MCGPVANIFSCLLIYIFFLFFFENPPAVKYSTWITVGGCGLFISMRDVQIGIDFCVLVYVGPILDLAAYPISLGFFQ